MTTHPPMQVGTVGPGRMGANPVVMIGGNKRCRRPPRPALRRLRPGHGLSDRTPAEPENLATGKTVTCIATRTAPATSSRWSTTASNTA